MGQANAAGLASTEGSFFSANSVGRINKVRPYSTSSPVRAEVVHRL